MKIDLGSGVKRSDGWTGVDLHTDADLQADIRSLPLSDDSVDEEFSSHALEHLAKADILPTLREWRRVLKPGGTLTLEVPDLGWCCRNWLEKQTNDWHMDAIFGDQLHPGNFHKTGFTREILGRYLADAGWGHVEIGETWNHEQKTLVAKCRKVQSKVALVIGSFQLPGVCELSVACVRKTCGDVPILISDDGSPPEHRQRLHELPKKYPNVVIRVNSPRIGHAGGDVQAFRNGIVWAKELGADVVCKVSQRFLVTRPGWLTQEADRLMGHSATLSSHRCREGADSFSMRTECVFLKTAAWGRAEVIADFEPKPIRIAAEEFITMLARRHFGGQVARCRLLSVDRGQRVDGVLWHCANDRSEFVALADEMGVSLGDYSCISWRKLLGDRYLLG